MVVAKRQEMVQSGAVDFGSFGFDDFDEPEAAYVSAWMCGDRCWYCWTVGCLMKLR